jgi:hypothetical protein
MRDKILFLIIVFVLFFLGCEKDKVSKLAGELTFISNCKSELKFSNLNYENDSVKCIDYAFFDDKLIIYQYDAIFNCCQDSIICDYALIDDTIKITENEINPHCRCTCKYDLKFKLTGLTSKRYVLKIVNKTNNQNIVIVSFDLAKKHDGAIYNSSCFTDGCYIGSFNYRTKDFWVEICFNNGKYEEWPSGGALFQKSYSCLTKGSYRIVNNSLIFTMDSLKFGSFNEPCINDMFIPGDYDNLEIINKDSIIFERGIGDSKIRYNLKRIQNK